MQITKVKIKLEHDDGHWSETEVVMPTNIADNVVSQILDWEEHCAGSISETREFIEKADKMNWDEVKKVRGEYKEEKKAKDYWKNEIEKLEKSVDEMMDTTKGRWRIW